MTTRPTFSRHTHSGHQLAPYSRYVRPVVVLSLHRYALRTAEVAMRVKGPGSGSYHSHFCLRTAKPGRSQIATAAAALTAAAPRLTIPALGFHCHRLMTHHPCMCGAGDSTQVQLRGRCDTDGDHLSSCPSVLIITRTGGF